MTKHSAQFQINSIKDVEELRGQGCSQQRPYLQKKMVKK